MEATLIWNIKLILVIFLGFCIPPVQVSVIKLDSITQLLPPALSKLHTVFDSGVIVPKFELPDPLKLLDDGQNILTPVNLVDFDDDIILKVKLPPKPKDRKKRKVDGEGWPNNEIPYEYNTKYNSYSAATKKTIEEAMKWWMDSTCMKFTPARSTDPVKLSFSNDGGCRSYVGYQPDIAGGIQEIKLQESHCFYSVGTAAHEIGHSLGLIHEQSRKDRDEHIKIHVDRINDASLHNFQVFYPARIPKGVHYDLNSIMHYSPQSFANNPFISLPTMTARNSKKDVLMGQRDALSFYDIKGINVEYCQGGCRDDCMNEGYILFKDGQCRCVCPEGLTGKRCEKVETTCGGEVNLNANGKRTVTSPKSYSNRKCVWLITAPKGHLVEVTFDKFDIAQDHGLDTKCAHTVEVRNNILGQRGDIYCGTGPIGPFNTLLDYKNHQMMVILDATDGSVSAGKGFSATFRAYKDACLSDPCINGGKCTPVGMSDYTCNCPGGYQGKNCDRVKDAAVSCGFAENMCNYRNDDRDQLDMQRMFASKKYLEIVQRQSNGNKFFLGAPVEFETGLKDKANLISPIFSGSAVSKRCLTFYYHMDGNYQTQGELHVNVRKLGGAQTQIFSARGKQGSGWKMAQREIDSSSDYEVIITIQASDVYPYNSLIAIDDVSIMPHACNQGPCSSNPCKVEGSVCVEPSSGGFYCQCPPGKSGDKCDQYDINGYTCSFEKDECGWKNEIYDNYEWVKAYGVADHQHRTGPTSGAGGQGSYMNADTSASGSGPGTVARLYSPYIHATTPICVEFYYNMHGEKVGSLDLKLVTNGQLGSSVFRKDGEQGTDWIRASVDVNMGSANQLVFEAGSGERHLSDVAIDEVKITRGTCASPQVVVEIPTVQHVATTAAPAPATTSAAPGAAAIAPSIATQSSIKLNRKLGNGDILAECNFERGLCEDDIVFLPSQHDYLWTRTDGLTPSAGTGPQYASEGNYYIFTEASDRDEGEKHIISTHLVYNSMREACVSFDYHMDGNGIGSLEVILKQERGEGETVWSKTGAQGANWHHADIDIDMSSTSFYQIMLVGTVGSNHRSDIALDDLKIVKGSCSSNQQQAQHAVATQKTINWSCDFEGNHICSPNLKQKFDDQFDWKVQTGPTPTAGTGPDRAASGSRYLVIESSDRSAGAKAALETAPIPAGVGAVCMKLSYHMKGQGMGRFTIYQTFSNGPRVVIFNRVGSQSNNWRSISQTIENSTEQYKIEFEVELSQVDLRYFGDVAIDMVSIKSGLCEMTSQ